MRLEVVLAVVVLAVVVLLAMAGGELGTSAMGVGYVARDSNVNLGAAYGMEE